MNRKMSHKLAAGIIRLGILFGMILICFKVGVFAFHYTYDIAKKPSAEQRSVKEVEVQIEKGSSTKTIAKKLEEQGLIRNAAMFRVKSRLYKYDGSFKQGTFILNTSMDEDEIMNILRSQGKKAEGVRFTIPEGYTIRQIAKRLQEENIIKQEEFITALNKTKFDYDFLEEIPERNNSMEGYLFPDTYEVRKEADANEIISKMLSRFDQIYKPEYRLKAQQMGYTMDQIITIASVIEQEAKLPEERPKIAGVIYNRLNTDMKLQMCSTVMYALGKKKERLLYADLEVQSPYNTYMYEGLPVGPICNPGEASIKAALEPEQHEYLYFVLKNEETGEHIFTKTGKEHLRQKQRYNQKF